MILPSLVLQTIDQELNNNLVNLGLKKSVVGSEDLKKEDIQPPYSIVWANFDTDANILEMGIPENIPVTIGVTIASGEHKTSLESIEESLTIAIKIIKLLVKDYTVTVDDQQVYFKLECKPMPMTFGVTSAALSSIICHFTYSIDFIYGNQD